MKPRSVVGAALVAVAVALVAVAALTERNGVDNYEPGTPEDTVQRYFQAIIDDRLDDALALFAPGLECGDQFRPTVNVSRVVLDDVAYNADRSQATARVQITETWGDGLFSPDESTFTEVLYLAATLDPDSETGGDTADGNGTDSVTDWRITDWPWPYFDCRLGD